MVEAGYQDSGGAIDKGVEVVRPSPGLVLDESACTKSTSNHSTAGQSLGETHRPWTEFVGGYFLARRYTHDLDKRVSAQAFMCGL